MSPIHRGGKPALMVLRGVNPVAEVRRGSSLVWAAPAPQEPQLAQFVGASMSSTPNSTTPNPVAVPADAQVGDLLIMVHTAYYTNSASLAGPDTFTQIGFHTRSSAHSVSVEWRLLQAGDPSSFTPIANTGSAYRTDLLAYRNADWSRLGSVTMATSPASSTTHYAPSITPSTDHGILLSIVSGGGGNEWAHPSQMAERTDQHTAASWYLSLATADEVRTSTSATGTRLWGGGGGTFSQVVGSLFIPSVDSA